MTTNKSLAKNEECDIFISYNWGIKEAVEKFHEKLEANGFRVWRDKFLKQGHQSLFEQLGKKIKESTVFLCFLTKDYVKSDNCRKELNYAAKLKKTIIYFPFSIKIVRKCNQTEKPRIFELRVKKEKN